tara:strand:- start:785 stop:1069 length:285 start_codon:yes stop_codon:yes gene_type:complete
MTKDKHVRDIWNKIADELLTGRTILGVRYLASEECQDLDWRNSPISLLLSERPNKGVEDRMWAFPSMDDEGNGAGALFTTSEDEGVLPVISANC